MKRSHKKLYMITNILAILLFGGMVSIGIATSENKKVSDDHDDNKDYQNEISDDLDDGGNKNDNFEDILNYFTFDIVQFNDIIQSSPDECWRKPSQNRKNAINNKLTDLQELIDVENYEEAYDKLLHDIKPKLTGLKENEYGEPWGNGIFEKVWVSCDDLQVSFEEECNLILSQINPLSQYDDDTTPPTIYIQYLGTNSQNEPGIWIVVIQDLESGIDEVKIIKNGNLVIYDYNGETVIQLNINVPGAVGVHTIEVFATNNDKDWENDQETSTMNDSVEIGPYVPPPPPIIIG